MKIAVIGGHMAPALGFIHALPKETDIVYIGRKHVFEGDKGESLEERVIREMGIHFYNLETGRIQRTFTAKTFPSLLKIPQGLIYAFTMLRKERPAIVVGFGGYLSVPVGLACKVLGIPLVIHESTLGAGLANRLLAPFAQKICISWDSSSALFPKEKTVLTGNPMLPVSKKKFFTTHLPHVSIVGGSGGSHAINLLVADALSQLLEKYEVVHQTGDAKEFGDYDMLRAVKEQLPKKLHDRFTVLKFIDPLEITSLFEESDVVVGRSGINTVTTLLQLRKKSVFIPLPTGQKNEQLENAKLVESEGLGITLLQHATGVSELLGAIQKILLKKMYSKWTVPIKKDGAENLVKEVLLCLPRTLEN